MRKNKTSFIKRLFSLRNTTFILGFIVFILSLSQLIVANAYSTRGGDLRNIERELDFLSRENQKLQNEINTLTSLNTIEKKALELGMVKISSDQIEILSDPTLVLNR